MSGHGFPNVSQIFNLNKGITITVTSRTIFACHDGPRGSEHDNFDLPCDLEKAHPLRPPFSATIGLFNFLSICIFPEK